MLCVRLLVGFMPGVALAGVLQPMGVPLRFYMVIIHSFPVVRTPCEPLACPEHPVFDIGPIGSENCAIPSFATAEDAQQWLRDNFPPPGAWYTVQAIDAAHAYAMVLLGPVLGDFPDAVPPPLLPDAEEQVAQAFTQLCGADRMASVEATGEAGASQ
jgi:hypothetical protein